MRIKTLPLISASLNLLLLGVIGLLLYHQKFTAKQSATLLPDATGTTESSVPIETPAALNSSFWSQLKSDNYHTYIINLRSTGLNETIRAIIEADMIQRRPQVRSKNYRRRDANPIASTRRSGNESQIAIDPSPNAAVAANTFSESPVQRIEILGQTDDLPDRQAVSMGARDTALRYATPVQIPLIFEDTAVMRDLLAANPSAVEQVRRGFVNAVGGPNPDRTAPEYRDRWVRSQPSSDEIFLAKFGGDAFLRQQLGVLHRPPVRPAP